MSVFTDCTHRPHKHAAQGFRIGLEGQHCGRLGQLEFQRINDLRKGCWKREHGVRRDHTAGALQQLLAPLSPQRHLASRALLTAHTLELQNAIDHLKQLKAIGIRLMKGEKGVLLDRMK